MNVLPRRSLLKAAARGGVRAAGIGLALGAAGSWFGRGHPPSDRERRDRGILRPPGALPEEEFLARCIRCDLCSEVCDTRCIEILPLRAGKAAGTPVIRAWRRGCDLCLECTQVCPSGALRRGLAKNEVRMGTAVVDERLCVSHNGTGACGACHTVCPFRNEAITQGIRNAPTVHPEHCTGCGLCEEACIVEDRKAIRVVSGRGWA